MPCYLKKTHQLAGNEKAYLLECDSTQDKVNLLSQLTLHDAQQPEVRRLAELVTMRAKTPDEGAELLHALVRDGVTFAPEQIETFSPTLWTLKTKRGDCDDSARALAALLLSIGYRVRFVTQGRPATHIVVQVKTEQGWQFAETTLPARFGETPQDALRRTGAQNRHDI